MKKSILIPAVLILICVAGAVSADSLINDPDRNYDLALHFEYGAIKVLRNDLRFGPAETATEFEFVTWGGQEILFPFQRLSADLTIADRHTIVLLYQPLTIVTESRFEEDVVVDDTTFAADTPMRLKYGFPFWRLSYLFNIVTNESLELSAGLSLQLRNASIIFASADGTQLTVNQNLGPVPIIKARARYQFAGGAFLGAEVDGFYASNAFLNGAQYPFEGSILDASLRGGVALKSGIETFLNLRFLGGTAVGTSLDEKTFWTEGSDISNETSNYLANLSLTLGVSAR